MGVGEWFSDFCGNLQVKDGGTISDRYKALTRRLNLDFWSTGSDVAHSLYVGSYGRNTAIDGFSDLDMIMQLPYAVYVQYDAYVGNGQSALLQAVKSSVEKTYSRTSIRADGQVIVIPFTDGISFELMPVFENTDGSYTFPDANGGGCWRKTDPRPEIAAIRTRNGSCNGNLVRLCRMTRAWKRTWDVPIGGLLVDTLAYQFIENWAYRDKSYVYYDWMARDFFDWLSGQSQTQDYWRAPGSGQFVFGKGLFQYKATRCHNIALQAIDHESANHEWSARQSWRQIFGAHFPG